MDMVKITPAPLCGKLKAPPSKSFAHRAIISAFLAKEPCRITNLAMSKDISATLDCIKQLGAEFEYNSRYGSAVIDGSKASRKDNILLDCGESGSTLRFFIPIALALNGKASFTGHGKLMERPLKPYFDIFDQKGIKYSLKGSILRLEGRLTPGEYNIDGRVSSQFITGLLFALPLLGADSVINVVGGLSSKAYIDITLDVLKKFGIKIENKNYSAFIIKGNQSYKAHQYRVEGDFSQAAFWLVAGAIGCDVVCSGLNESGLQGDKKILEIIKQTGAKIIRTGSSSFQAVCTSDMHGIRVDADEIPDLVPILAVLLCFCKGKSRIENAGRLRIKESDRLAAISTELKKMGAKITEGDDFLEIEGCQVLSGAKLSAWNDHRIAMALAIAACRCEGEASISGAKKAVTKSYPDFFEDYISLGGVVE